MLQGREAEHNNLAKRLDGRCCFNHLIQLPEKYGIPHNLYPYEYELYSELMRPKPKDTDDIVTRQTFRDVFVTKATGLGITEFLLRFIAWQCVRNDDFKGHRICVVVGPNQALAITLIKRIRELFLNNKSGYQVLFPGSATEIFLNGCEIKSYPSHHVDAMRGLTDIKFVLLDEADFFPINDATVVRDVAERYIAKSDPFIVMVSTPNMPGALMHQISELSDENCIYKRMYFPYTVGENKIYSTKDIEIAERSQSFSREYDLQWAGTTGSVFLPSSIDQAISLGKSNAHIYTDLLKENASLRHMLQFYCGVDIGFGSSKFGICLVGIIDQLVYVLETIELTRETFENCIAAIMNLFMQYQIDTDNIRVLVDGSAPSVVTALKAEMQEDVNYLSILENRKRMKIRDLFSSMKVIPVNFNTANKKNMLLNAKELLERGLIVLDSQRHHNLVLALRTASAEDMLLDKSVTVNHDILDAFTLSINRVSAARDTS
jgi:hypothetical protein